MEVGVPDAAGRAEILQVLLRGVPHAMKIDDTANTNNTPGDGYGGIGGEKSSSQSSRTKGGIKELAERTHGFVGADLQLLVKEAALQALRRTRWGWGAVGGSDWEKLPERSSGDDGNAEQLPTLTPADFLAALPLVSPSGLREVAVEVPSVKWDDIGGMKGVKQSLREVRSPAPRS